jgi:pimeloyl-ACP methyl ester carboxylesterase
MPQRCDTRFSRERWTSLRRRFARVRLTAVRDAEVRYARHRDGKRLAYEVFGDGPSDIVVSQHMFPIDLLWELPQLSLFMETLGRLARVIVFDALGHGASDDVSDMRAARMETLCDSVLAVLDAAHADRVAFFDMTFGVNGVTFAATYPQRVRSLMLTNLRASWPEIRETSAKQRQRLALYRLQVESLEVENPRVAHDPALRQWWGRARRLLVSPEQSLDQIDFAANIDVEPVLPAVQAPTLVLHRRESPIWDIETSRVAAAKIPGARSSSCRAARVTSSWGRPPPFWRRSSGFCGSPSGPSCTIEFWRPCCSPTSWRPANSSRRVETTPGGIPSRA